MTNQSSKAAIWTSRVITAVVAVQFTMAGLVKILQIPAAVEGFAKIGVPQGALIPLGMIELACLAFYLIPRTTVMGTMLLTGYLGGATMANLISKGDLFLALGVGLLVWVGAYLRVPELRGLFPVVRKPVGRETRAGSPAVARQVIHEAA